MVLFTFYHAFVATVAIIFWYLRTNFTYWAVRGIEHEYPKFPWGSMKAYRKTKNFVEILDPLYKKYKNSGRPFTGYYMFLRPCLLVTTLDLIKHMLDDDHEQFEDRGMFHNTRNDPLTGNIMWLDSPDWLIMRQKLSSSFEAHRMDFMFNCVNDVGRELADWCIDFIEKTAQNIVNISDTTTRFSSDVIGRCGFGIDCNAMRDTNDCFYVMGQRALRERWQHGYVEKFVEFVPEYAKTCRYRKINPEVSAYYLRIIREVMEERVHTQHVRRDFFTILLSLKAMRVFKTEELAAQAFMFVLGGFDTIAATICFALYEIAKHPSVQRRLRKEIQDQIATTNGLLTFEAIHKKLPYMDCVISETLRIYPVHPYIQRMPKVQYNPGGDVKCYIEPDTICIIPVFSLHRDPAYYPEPEKFIPDRFTPEAKQARRPFTYLPFGDGNRNCIGTRFGKMAVTIALVHLLKNFKFSSCAATIPVIEFDPVSLQLVSKKPVYLKMEKISTNAT